MNDEKRKIITALKVRVVADRAGVTPSYIYALIKGDMKSSPHRAVELAKILNTMCNEYGIEPAESFNAVDFNADLDPSLHVSPDASFNVYCLAFAESRQMTAGELTERFSSDRRLGKALMMLQAREVPFISYEGCIIKHEGTW
tara:strand:+ start:9310 stop:9738 length:429 start_codon:yes stop_codon:yes gene_type:complete